MDESGNDKKQQVYQDLRNYFAQESPDGKKVAFNLLYVENTDGKSKKALALVVKNLDTGEIIYLSK